MRRRSELFPVNVWPPLVDVITLVLAALVLLMVVMLASQRGLLTKLRSSQTELEKVREDKARIERRLKAIAVGSQLEVQDGRVILQGEVLFDSGSDELLPAGREFLKLLGPGLGAVLTAEPDQMVMVGGHTDNVPIQNERFPSNWELSTSRAVAVARVLTTSGLPPERVVASGFGPHHPRVPNHTAAGKQQNRRIEVLLVPLTAVTNP